MAVFTVSVVNWPTVWCRSGHSNDSALPLIIQRALSGVLHQGPEKDKQSFSTVIEVTQVCLCMEPFHVAPFLSFLLHSPIDLIGVALYLWPLI